MFQKKLLAFVCTGVCASWSTIWIGDNLSQLSNSDLNYFVSFYGRDNLRLTSECVYDSDDSDDSDDYFDDFDDWLVNEI